MRIVHVASSLSMRGAGVQSVVAALARAQAQAGHQVYALGLEDDEWRIGERGDWTGIETRVFPTLGPRAFGYAPGMAAALDAWAPEIVHLHGLWMHPGRSVLQWHRCSGLPFILSVHGMLSEVALGYSPIKKRLVRAWFQDQIFSRATCVHATNTTERDEFRRFGILGAVAIVPNGVGVTPRPEDLPPLPGRSILTLGRIHPKKGIDVLLQAWAALEAEFPDWSLRIVGPDENNHRAELEDLARRLGLVRVIFRGPVYGPVRDAEMAQADLFVLPTRSENFALTVAESLMLEVPVISSKGAPWAGLDEEGCGRWIDLTPEAFADAMRHMMMLPPEARRAMGSKGRAWMLRDFSWERVGATFGDLYRWAAQGGARPVSLEQEQSQS